MTLDEAIQHHEENFCGQEHKQIAEWLKELKQARKELERKTRIIENIPLDLVIDAENAVDDEDGVPRRIEHVNARIC